MENPKMVMCPHTYHIYPFRIILRQLLKHHSPPLLITLPVIILKCLVPQQQVPEAVARRKWRHLSVHLSQLER